MTFIQIVPGVRHWTAVHPNIHTTVSSYAFEGEGILVNPLLPEGDQSVIDGIEVSAIVLTNRHHRRDAQKIAGRQVPIYAPQSGLYALHDIRPAVNGYADGDELPGGLRAFRVGALSSDEYAVFSAEHRALAVADGVIRTDDGPLRVVPDSLMGEDPEQVKVGLAAAYAHLSETLDFDHLLLAHGAPVVGTGRDDLRAFAAELSQAT
jgi:hypothetical protein